MLSHRIPRDNRATDRAKARTGVIGFLVIFVDCSWQEFDFIQECVGNGYINVNSSGEILIRELLTRYTCAQPFLLHKSDDSDLKSY